MKNSYVKHIIFIQIYLIHRWDPNKDYSRLGPREPGSHGNQASFEHFLNLQNWSLTMRYGLV